ncbi:SH3 domain-binding protein 5 [Homalodisca vitripennis]|nr:SH3 domain-binding protein 5 [Homalodisca vitripennis]
MELDEANGTFRMLMNDSTRRITLWSHKLGSCVEKARPYYEALEISKQAQIDCQRAAVKFQRANEIHAAAKETVALAEARYLSKQDEWKFDAAWQEMLNHATKKVMEAEHAKAESGREHQKRATLYNAAEQKVQMLEQKLRRNIIKSRPYFEEKAVCESSLAAQKQRINELQRAISAAKSQYAASLRQLEAISEEIHLRRKDKVRVSENSHYERTECTRTTELGSLSSQWVARHTPSGRNVYYTLPAASNTIPNTPKGPREPGVGAELVPSLPDEVPLNKLSVSAPNTPSHCGQGKDLDCRVDVDDTLSLGSVSRATSSVVSDSEDQEEDLDMLRAHVKELSQMSSEELTDEWESELSETIHRLDNALLLRECEEELASTSTQQV